MNKLVYVAIIALGLTVLNSCTKGEGTKFRYVGSIFNAVDSSAYENTKFKIWAFRGSSSNKDFETFFTTDSLGNFDVTTDHLGTIAWPGYYKGTGYFGPQPAGPEMLISSVTEQGVVTGTYKIYIKQGY
ncbi:MAG: hypothetical protein RL660_2203 [Bacteroidota bacterium]|jgi:hypothetical protein